MARVRTRLVELGLDALVLAHGADLSWLTGYEAMPLERPTLLVLPADADATLLVPLLEAPRVRHDPRLFAMRPWGESEDPVRLAAELLGRRERLAISDRAFASTLLGLQALLPHARFRVASVVTGPLRSVKDDAELAALARAAAAADRVAEQLLGGEVPLIGRSEAEVAADLGRRLLAEGHAKVNFAIVASGPNAASPHHEPGSRRIGPSEAVVCDFGGVFRPEEGEPGYCSDLTRTVVTGPPSPELAEVHHVVEAAQQAGVEAAVVGEAAEEVDRAARRVVASAALGDRFVHRTGHGIGLEEHEEPYLVEGNRAPLLAGQAFSVEPGAYLPSAFGVRIEDIVVAAPEGPRRLNHVPRGLVVVEA
jgi:Xaa-Pro aminopeptidase